MVARVWFAALVSVVSSGFETGPWIRVPNLAGPSSVPVVCGLPLPRGRTIDELDASVHDSSGRRVAATVVPAIERAAQGAEGRRWIRAEFVAKPGSAYRVRWESRSGRVADEVDPAEAIRVERDGSRIRLQGGTIEATFDARGGPFPVEIRRLGETVLGPRAIDLGWPDGTFERRATDGEVLSLKVETVTASRVTVLAVGSFGDPSKPSSAVHGPSIVDYRIRTTVFPTLGEIQFDMRLHPRGMPSSAAETQTGIESFASFVVRPVRSTARLARVAGRPGTLDLERSGDVAVEIRSDDARTLAIQPRARSKPGRAPNVGTLAVEGERHRVRVLVPSFLTRFPKRLSASSDGIRVGLVRVSSWKPHASRRFGVLVRFEDPRGGIDDEASARRPLVVPAEPRWYREHALPQGVRDLRGKERSQYERLVDRVFVAHGSEREATRAYGEWDFGDWRFFEGWGNLEFDTSFGCFLEFYRSGRREAWTIGMQGIEHWVDVDRAVDVAAAEFGLPLRHGRDHGNRVDLGHVWIEGLLHAAYLTGDAFLLEAFEEMTAASVRVLEDRPQTVTRRERDAAWQLLAMAAAHEALGDPSTRRALASLEARVLDRVDPATGWIRLDDARSGATSDAGWKVTPWVAGGIVLPALVRSWSTTRNPSCLAAVRRLSTALCDGALETGASGMRASLTLADGEIVDRGGFVRGDWALFGARGFVDAAVLLDDDRLLRSGRRLVREALEELDREPPAFDGRARSRILRNGPFLGTARR